MKPQSFKEAMDSITYADVLCLRASKRDKTTNKYIELFKSGKFTKSDILGLTKLFSSYRFATPERKNSIEALQGLAMDCVGYEYIHSNFQCDVLHFKRGMKITKEQTALGKAWLKNHFFKANGKPRSGNNTEGVGERVLNIAKQVSRFEFVGILVVKNQFGDINSCLPIYRTFNSKGEYFDYSPIHWGQPIIMEGR